MLAPRSWKSILYNTTTFNSCVCIMVMGVIVIIHAWCVCACECLLFVKEITNNVYSILLQYYTRRPIIRLGLVLLGDYGLFVIFFNKQFTLYLTWINPIDYSFKTKYNFTYNISLNGGIEITCYNIYCTDIFS